MYTIRRLLISRLNTDDSVAVLIEESQLNLIQGARNHTRATGVRRTIVPS